MKLAVNIRDTGVAITHILKMISEGFSYSQILAKNPALTMGDIMASAGLACQVLEQFVDEEGSVEINYRTQFAFTKGRFVSIEKVRQQHPRAYTPWSSGEDNKLADMFKHGAGIKEMATQHQRQPGAIMARLEKLELRR